MSTHVNVERRTDGRQQVSNLELFFDLVFVYAVTQVSHILLAHVTWAGALHATMALLAIWWAWNYTTWLTNELDPESPPVLVVVLAVMLGCLILAVATPGAFGSEGLLFAVTYVAIQFGRQLFLAFGAAAAGTVERARALAILVWFAVSGSVWIAGGIVHGHTRVALWLAALAIDYLAPLHVYWLPGGRRASSADWEVSTSHFTERFGAFVIIALGESIVLIGSAVTPVTAVRVIGLAGAFASTSILFLLYFNRSSRYGAQLFERAEHRTETARDAYTYLHVVLVGGIIAAAVGDQLVLRAPLDRLSVGEGAVAVAGPALYLLGLAAFRLRLAGSLSPTRTTGALACVALGAVAPFVPALLVGFLLLGVLAVVLVSDIVLRIRREREG